jgi:cytidylate kinase
VAGFVIAVDGPAASGKGTIASGLAREYGLPYLDSGLLYRAVGHAANQPPYSEADASLLAERLVPEALDNPAYRTREAGEFASRVAVNPAVRAALFDFQRRFADDPRGAVIDGRDIGTVIAPDAPAKLFVTARPEVRAERRWRQLIGQGETVTLDAVLADIRQRDERDSARATAPLVRALDATLLDTSEMTIDEAADAARRIVEAARVRWEASQRTNPTTP